MQLGDGEVGSFKIFEFLLRGQKGCRGPLIGKGGHKELYVLSLVTISEMEE